MNFLLSIPLMPLFSTLGHVSAKTGLSPVLSLLLLDLVTAVWICPQFSLLTSTITWGVVWAACAQAPMGRFSGTAELKQTGHEVGVRGGNVMLAGCLLLVGVCERSSGVQSHWVKVRDVLSYLWDFKLTGYGARQLFLPLSTSFVRLAGVTTRPLGARGGSCFSLQLRRRSRYGQVL